MCNFGDILRTARKLKHLTRPLSSPPLFVATVKCHCLPYPLPLFIASFKCSVAIQCHHCWMLNFTPRDPCHWMQTISFKDNVLHPPLSLVVIAPHPNQPPHCLPSPPLALVDCWIYFCQLWHHYPYLCPRLVALAWSNNFTRSMPKRCVFMAPQVNMGSTFECTKKNHTCIFYTIRYQRLSCLNKQPVWCAQMTGREIRGELLFAHLQIWRFTPQQNHTKNANFLEDTIQECEEWHHLL